jgi:hypothetical protein
MKPNLLQFRADLVRAQGSGELVRVHRSVESGWANGYVVGVGPEFFAVCLVSDLIIFNGFQAFRFVDLSAVEAPAPHADFVDRALRLRKALRPRDPSIDLKDLPSLLRSASAAFPLIALHREIKDPDVCHIGSVEGLTNDAVVLKAIGPDADWLEERETFALADITRVDFGGLYEEALSLVAKAG